MIPLGSCTMKLNATAEMEPISFPGFADLHPFAPAEDAPGYVELVESSSAGWPRSPATPQVSIQPNAGSQGELAGLLAIRGYHRARGDDAARRLPDPVERPRHQRRLGGDGRHAGGRGQGDRGRLGRPRRPARASARQHRDELAAIMVTYPSTHGVYEDTHHRAVRDRARARRPGVRRRRQPQRACSGWPSRASSAATSRTSTCTRRSASRTAAAVPASGRWRSRRTSRRTCPSHPMHPDERHGATGSGRSAPRRTARPGILPISWAYIAMMGAPG